MWLPWKAALALAAALALVPFLVVIGLFARPRNRGLRYALSFARETTVILGLCTRCGSSRARCRS